MEQIGEIWYQRCHRLREYWQDETNPYDRRSRAYGLWVLMVQRTLRLANAFANAKQQKFLGKFPPGGIKANIP